MSPDEAAVGDFGNTFKFFKRFIHSFNSDLFNFTEQHSVVFHPATVNEQRSELVTFLMPRDNIVELRELFIWRLSVNDSRVRLDPEFQVVRLDNQDGMSFVYEITLSFCLYYSFQCWV